MPLPARLAARIAAPIAALLAAAPALTSVAAAESGGAMGVSIGRSEDEQSFSPEANRTLGVWGRFAYSRRISGQLELQQIEAPDSGARLRGVTALIVIDLIHGSRLVPVLFAGAGLDRGSFFNGAQAMEAHHFEGGLGLEYRSHGGVILGADARLGGRSVDNGDVILPVAVDAIGPAGPPSDPPDVLFAPPGISEGQYFSLRLTAGVRL